MSTRSIQTFEHLLRGGLDFARTVRDERRLFSEKSAIHYEETVDFPVSDTYVVSTDHGIFSLSNGSIRQVAKLSCFGIALNDRYVYVAGLTSGGSSSAIYRGDRDALDDIGARYNWECLYSVPIRDHGERIHQISLIGDSLWLANTANNSFLKIDAESGKWQSEMCPFRCSFGQRIKRDHNHVNSISAYPNYLLFGAWRINMNGCLGIAGAGQIELYASPNAGLHDCHFSDDSILYSDSFRFDRAEENGPNGALVRDGSIVDSEYFDANAVGCLRGMAGAGDQIVVGLSFAGGQETRRSGHGGLLLLQEGKVTHRITLPCAQVYDIVRSDGQTFDDTAIPATFPAASDRLRRTFGDPVDTLRLTDSLMPQNLNVSLNGAAESRIDEYL